MGGGGGAVWFDFENTPHVLFLEPILRELERGGWTVVSTAKPQSQTLELARRRGIPVEVVGGGNLKGRFRKIVFGLGRAAQLAAWAVRRGRPLLLVSSSRSANVAARWLGIPSVGILDYEHAEYRPFALACDPLFLPDILCSAKLPGPVWEVADFFEGLKENLYIDRSGLDRDVARAMLGVSSGSYVVVARPPAHNAHYARRVDESADLWLRIVRDIEGGQDSRIFLMPRDREQFNWLHALFGGRPRIHLYPTVLDGPSIVAAADLVVSGGGTMNREAAVLGVPAWSVFTGPTPHIDERLAKEGRLRWVRTDEEYESALSDRAPSLLPPRGPFPRGFQSILKTICVRLEQALAARGAKAGPEPAEVME
jgi:predicted glycosyltransferase